MADACDRHAWASVGVAAGGGDVVRVRLRETRLAWTREPLDPDAQEPWSETDRSTRRR